MCSAERLQGQPKSEGIFESTRTYVQGYRSFCIGQEATQQPPGHSVPSSLLTPSWSFGTVRALRLLSDSASSWQCSTLLDTWYNFPCSGALAVRHLAPSSSRDPPPPFLAAWLCHSTLETAPSSLLAVSLAARCPPDHSTATASSLFDALRSVRHPPGQWKLTVLLPCGRVMKLVVVAPISYRHPL